MNWAEKLNKSIYNAINKMFGKIGIETSFGSEETPSGTPSGTPGETPSGTPGETPNGTPGETPGETPSGTPGETPSGTPGETIPDETNKNMEYPIGQDWQNYLEEMQERQWEREDAIRRETQMREDTAYQRARADAEKAGINLNLTGLSPANSGGGITQATGMNYAPYETAIKEALTLWQTELENNTKIDENTKDRLTEIFGNTMTSILIALVTSGKLKK